VRAFSDEAMDELVPLFGDRHCIRIAGEQTGERVGNLTVVDPPEPLIGQILRRGMKSIPSRWHRPTASVKPCVSVVCIQ
jgi:hypothetical protein